MPGLSRTDLLIVGAGIAGLTTAMALYRRGYRVALVEAGAPAGESTWAGGGMVCPVPPWDYPEPIQRLVARGRELYPALIAELESATGIDCQYEQCGLLLLGPPGATGERWLERNAPSVERAPAGRFEPALSEVDCEAVRVEGMARVRNPRLGRALAAWLEGQGVALERNSPVLSLELAGDAVTGVRLEDGERIACEAAILAAGAWTDRILEASLLDGLGMVPVRGQVLLFNPERTLLSHLIHTGTGYLIPRADGRILAGSTLEEEGFDRRGTAGGYRRLLMLAAGTLPALDEADLECHWWGFRPRLPGELPAIGAYPGMRGLWINTGGFRNGLGMAPAAAEHLIRQLEGGPMTGTFPVVPRSR